MFNDQRASFNFRTCEIVWKPTLEIPWVLAGVAGVQYDEVGGGRGCGGRGGVKDSLRAVTRGPPSPLSRTSPTPKAGPGRQAAAILNGLSQNRPIYLKFFLNLSQILSTLLQNPMCSAQAKQRLHKSFTKRDERSKESYKTCVDCSKHCLLQLSSC